MRRNAVAEISIEEIQSYFDPSLIEDEDCPPSFVLSSQPFSLTALNDEALFIVSPLSDGSLLIDASSVSISFTARQQFFLHICLEGVDDKFAALEIVIDLKDYLFGLSDIPVL